MKGVALYKIKHEDLGFTMAEFVLETDHPSGRTSTAVRLHGT